MKELEALYSGEWVLLVNPKHIERLEMLRNLVFHSKDRNELQGGTQGRTPHGHLYVGKLLKT
jgi:hypothetical protein